MPTAEIYKIEDENAKLEELLRLRQENQQLEAQLMQQSTRQTDAMSSFANAGLVNDVTSPQSTAAVVADPISQGDMLYTDKTPATIKAPDAPLDIVGDVKRSLATNGIAPPASTGVQNITSQNIDVGQQIRPVSGDIRSTGAVIDESAKAFGTGLAQGVSLGLVPLSENDKKLIEQNKGAFIVGNLAGDALPVGASLSGARITASAFRSILPSVLRESGGKTVVSKILGNAMLEGVGGAYYGALHEGAKAINGEDVDMTNVVSDAIMFAAAGGVIHGATNGKRLKEWLTSRQFNEFAQQVASEYGNLPKLYEARVKAVAQIEKVKQIGYKPPDGTIAGDGFTARTPKPNETIDVQRNLLPQGEQAKQIGYNPTEGVAGDNFTMRERRRGEVFQSETPQLEYKPQGYDAAGEGFVTKSGGRRNIKNARGKEFRPETVDEFVQSIGEQANVAKSADQAVANLPTQRAAQISTEASVTTKTVEPLTSGWRPEIKGFSAKMNDHLDGDLKYSDFREFVRQHGGGGAENAVWHLRNHARIARRAPELSPFEPTRYERLADKLEKDLMSVAKKPQKPTAATIVPEKGTTVLKKGTPDAGLMERLTLKPADEYKTIDEYRADMERLYSLTAKEFNLPNSDAEMFSMAKGYDSAEEFAFALEKRIDSVPKDRRAFVPPYDYTPTGLSEFMPEGVPVLSPAKSTLDAGSIPAPSNLKSQSVTSRGESTELGAFGVPTAVKEFFSGESPLNKAWNGVVDRWTEKFKAALPEPIARRMIYGYGRPEEYMRLLERRDLSVGQAIEEVANIAKEAKRNIDKGDIQNVFDWLDPTARERGVTIPEEYKVHAQRIREKLTDIGKQAVEQGLLKEETRAANEATYLRRFYTKHESGADNPAVDMFKKFRRNKIEGVKKRTLETPEQREAAGLIADPVYAFAKGSAQMVHDIETARMFKLISENSEWVSDAAKEGFAKLPNEASYGALAGKHVQQGIYDDIREITRVGEIGSIVKGYEKALSLWKMGKTAYNPATHGRNIFSNAILAEIGGLRSPKVYAKAIKEFKGKGKYFQEAKDTGLMGSDWYGNEIAPLLDHMESKNLTKLDEVVDAISSSKIAELAKKPADLYQAEEQFFKLAMFIDRRLKGDGIEQASKYAEKFLFNYGKIPPFIKKVRRSIFGAPFVTFTYKALPLVLEQAVKHPVRVGKYIAAAYALEEYSKSALGLSDKEIKEIDKSRKTGGLWQVLLPFRDDQDRPIVWDLTYNLPWGDIAEGGWLGGVVPPQVALSNPALKMPAELLLNKNSFTGREIVRRSDTTGERIEKGAEHIYRTLTPPLMPGNYNARALWSMFTGKPNARGDISSPIQAIPRTLFGLKFQSVDLKREKALRLYFVRLEMEDIRSKMASVQLDKSLSQDEKNSKIRDLQQRLKGLRDKL